MTAPLSAPPTTQSANWMPASPAMPFTHTVLAGIWTVATFCPWCYDHDRYPYAGVRTCRVCGHVLEYQVATRYDPWHGGGG